MDAYAGCAAEGRGRSRHKSDAKRRSSSESKLSKMARKLKNKKRHVTNVNPLQNPERQEYQLWSVSPGKDDPPYPLFVPGLGRNLKCTVL